MNRAYTAASGSPLCHTFQILARQTWEDIRDSAKAQLLRGEETITDDLLLALVRRHPREVVIKQFNKPEEKRTGADWEWWFGDDNRWFGMRVQAKRLDVSNLHYRGIDRKIGKTGQRQIDRLIKDAHLKECYPAYIFYNYWCVSLYDPVWKCGTFAPVPELLGCTVADAEAVGRLARTVTPLVEVDNIAWPWMCLVCCQAFSNNMSLPERIRGFACNMSDNSELVPKVTECPPQYVVETPERTTDMVSNSKVLDKNLAGAVIIRKLQSKEKAIE